MRVLHLFDLSIPLHSGYTFRSRAILREQRRLGWETFHLTSPKHTALGSDREVVDGLEFFRTLLTPSGLARLSGARQPVRTFIVKARPCTLLIEGGAGLDRAHSVELNARHSAQVPRGTWAPDLAVTRK